MVAEVDSLDQYKIKYCQNFVKKYSGEKGLLKAEDGTELLCKFEAGQLENGKLILICDFSVFDFQKCFPEFFDLDKSSISEIKVLMIFYFSSICEFLIKFNNFKGETSDGLMNLTGVINLCHEIDPKSIDDHDSEQVRVVYTMTELTASTSTIEDIHCVKFGITNFRFGDKSDKILSFDIKGIKKLTIKKIENYEDVEDILKFSKGIRVTCNLIVEVDNKTKLKDLENIVYDLCDVMSIAWGTRVQWIYYCAYNSELEMVLWKHVRSVTKPYHYNELIISEDLKIMNNFLESSYIALAEKQNMLRYKEKTAKPLINAYLDAKAESDYLQGRGIKLVVVMEMLKELAIKLRLTNKSIIKKEYFEDLKPIIEEILGNAIEKSIKSEYSKRSEENIEKDMKEIKGKILTNISNLNDTKPLLINKAYFNEAKSKLEEPLIGAIRKSVSEGCKENNEQDAEEQINELKDEIFNQISGLNYVHFKKILRSLCDYINLQIDDNDLQSVVDSRNRLIHEGIFFCESDNMKKKYGNKNKDKIPSQFQDIDYEYYFLMNFVDKCFLKLLGYKGDYYKWVSAVKKYPEKLL